MKDMTPEEVTSLEKAFEKKEFRDLFPRKLLFSCLSNLLFGSPIESYSEVLVGKRKEGRDEGMWKVP